MSQNTPTCRDTWQGDYHQLLSQEHAVILFQRYTSPGLSGVPDTGVALREIPKVKPSMGVWEGEEGPESLQRERKVAGGKREESTLFLQAEGSLLWLCGSLAWGFGTKSQNHIARDYYMAAVSATAASGAGGGGDCHLIRREPLQSGLLSKLRNWISLKEQLFWGKLSRSECLCRVECFYGFWSSAELGRLLNRE